MKLTDWKWKNILVARCFFFIFRFNNFKDRKSAMYNFLMQVNDLVLLFVNLALASWRFGSNWIFGFGPDAESPECPERGWDVPLHLPSRSRQSWAVEHHQIRSAGYNGQRSSHVSLWMWFARIIVHRLQPGDVFVQRWIRKLTISFCIMTISQSTLNYIWAECLSWIILT